MSRLDITKELSDLTLDNDQPRIIPITLRDIWQDGTDIRLLRAECSHYGDGKGHALIAQVAKALAANVRQEYGRFMHAHRLYDESLNSDGYEAINLTLATVLFGLGAPNVEYVACHQIDNSFTGTGSLIPVSPRDESQSFIPYGFTNVDGRIVSGNDMQSNGMPTLTPYCYELFRDGEVLAHPVARDRSGIYLENKNRKAPLNTPASSALILKREVSEPGSKEAFFTPHVRLRFS